MGSKSYYRKERQSETGMYLTKEYENKYNKSDRTERKRDKS